MGKASRLRKQRKAQKQAETPAPPLSLETIENMTVQDLKDTIASFNTEQAKKMWASHAVRNMHIEPTVGGGFFAFPVSSTGSLISIKSGMGNQTLKAVSEVADELLAIALANAVNEKLPISDDFDDRFYKDLLKLFVIAGFAEDTPIPDDMLPPEPDPDVTVEEPAYVELSAQLNDDPRTYLGDFAIDMDAVLSYFRSQKMDIEKVVSYRFVADVYIDWLVSFRRTNIDQQALPHVQLEQRWVRLPVGHSKYINDQLKKGLISPYAFTQIAPHEWLKLEGGVPQELSSFAFEYPKIVNRFHPLAEWSQHQDGIRRELSSLRSALDSDPGRLEFEVMDKGVVLFQRGDETDMAYPLVKDDFPWLVHYLRGNPQQVEVLSQVMNLEAPGMDKERSFEEQIQAVEIPKHLGDYTPVPVTTAVK